MDMSSTEATARLQELRDKAEEAAVMAQALKSHLEGIADGLEALSAQGFTPGRMGSAISLANEAKSSADDNESRIFSLFMGIGEMI